MASLALILLIIILLIIIVSLFVYLFALKGRTTSDDNGNQTTCSAPPASPQNVVAVNTTADIIAITWDPVLGATSYRAFINKNPNFSTSFADDLRITTNTSATFGGLETGFTYYVKVTALNVCGESLPSSEDSVTIPFAYPNRFQIVNRADNTLDVAVDFLGVEPGHAFITTDCNAADCWWTYSGSDRTIRLQSDQSICLTRINNDVWALPCLSSSLQDRQWEYTQSDNTLCMIDNPLTDCLRLPPNFSNPGSLGDYVKLGNKTGNFVSEWRLLEV